MQKHLWATALTDTSTTAEEELGIIRWEFNSSNNEWEAYKYVQLDSSAANAAANGTVLTYKNGYGYVVTDDISASKQNFVAGVAIGSIDKGSYGWMKVYGYHSAVKTNGDDDISKGDTLIVDASTDGTCDSVAAGTAPTHKILGVATADDNDTADTVAAMVTCL